jgi:hypothetical protein
MLFGIMNRISRKTLLNLKLFYCGILSAKKLLTVRASLTLFLTTLHECHIVAYFWLAIGLYVMDISIQCKTMFCLFILPEDDDLWWMLQNSIYFPLFRTNYSKFVSEWWWQIRIHVNLQTAKIKEYHYDGFNFEMGKT